MEQVSPVSSCTYRSTQGTCTLLERKYSNTENSLACAYAYYKYQVLLPECDLENVLTNLYICTYQSIIRFTFFKTEYPIAISQNGIRGNENPLRRRDRCLGFDYHRCLTAYSARGERIHIRVRFGV